MRVPLAAIAGVLGVIVALQPGCATSRPASPPPPIPTTPPMGWNSWNSGIVLTEKNIDETIDAMVSSGMREAGYRYVNLDAGWAAPQRDSNGELQADPARFPDGIAAVARHAHDRGMRLGLYASPFDERCSAQPALASVGHEGTDAREFADWGVDYLKYDWCRDEADHTHQVQVFTAMRDALRATGRPIVYSINPNSSDDPTAGSRYDWSGIADMARTTTDLVPVWRDTMPPLGPSDPFGDGAFRGTPDQFAAAAQVVGPSRRGYWTDPDALIVGVGWSDFVVHHLASVRNQLKVSQTDLPDHQLSNLLLRQPNMTADEQRANLSLWAMLSAPLIAGNDIRSMSLQTREILINRGVIRIDQDSNVDPARALADSRVLVKPLSDGAVAVAFYNSADTPAVITTTIAQTGVKQAPCYTVRDLWSRTETHTTDVIGGAPVPPHAVSLLRVTPSCR
jgi:alpha-galactosidase